MNVTSLSRGVPVSSQSFSALDRNLIAIMKYYSYSTVKKHSFCFWTKLWQLPPIWINFTQVSWQFFTLIFITHITWVLRGSYHCGGCILLRVINEFDGQADIAPECLQSRIQKVLCLATVLRGDNTSLPVLGALVFVQKSAEAWVFQPSTSTANLHYHSEERIGRS